MHCLSLIGVNHKNRTFLDFIKPSSSSVSPFGPFHGPKLQISLPFYIVQLVKSLTFHIPEDWKRYPFWVEPPRIGHYREYPPGHHAHKAFPTKGPTLVSFLIHIHVITTQSMPSLTMHAVRKAHERMTIPSIFTPEKSKFKGSKICALEPSASPADC